MDEKERFYSLLNRAKTVIKSERAIKKLCKKVDKYIKHRNKLLIEKRLINAMFDEYEKQFGGKFTRL